MAAQKGRLMLIKVSDGQPTPAFNTVGGIRTRSFAINNEQVDITDSDNAPWRELLGDTGLRSMSVSGSGVWKGDVGLVELENLALSGALRAMELTYENGDKFEASFQVASYTTAGEHTAEQTFEVTLESSGTVTVTRA